MTVPPAQYAFTAPAISELAPLFPGYDFEILIATGGMGAVYRAVQKSLERAVAIKILPQEFSKDAAFCAGFEAEAKAMARLNHPNLIGVYDFGEVKGMLYIVMEYVPGKSLFHSAHGTPIDPDEVIRIVTGICSGLAHAHENGIIHRDIKPSNILLDLNAQPKIGDFGLARPIERKIQEGEEIFGTPHYTAPEVVQAPHSVDSRADIFSVGVMLHELLTGRLPADDPRPASHICHCDPRFDSIVRKATNPIPAARYASASEIAADLHAIAVSAGPKVLRTAVPAASPHLAPRPGRAVRPVPATADSSSSTFIVLLVAAILVVGLILAIMSNREEKPVTDTPPIPVETTPTPPTPPTPIETNLRPAPDPRPTPKPKPEPEPEPEKDPEPQDETPPTPTPDPEIPGDPPPQPVATPTFDTNEFFQRARRIMQDRATPLIAARDAELAKNLGEYERGLRRLIRRIDSRSLRDVAEERATAFLGECTANGSRLPEETAQGFREFSDYRDLHAEFLTKQEAVDKLLNLELSKLSPVYILGIEKQIERLDPAVDESALGILKEEIEKTRMVSDHFTNLMLGITTDGDDAAESPTPVTNP
jgi:serine/threonine protein kinase